MKTIAFTALLLSLLHTRAALGDEGRLERFLADINSANHDMRAAARERAPELGAAAVGPLGKIIVEGKREPSLTARAALERIVHHAARPGAEAERGPVAAELLKLILPGNPAHLRREALHLAGFIAGDAEVAAVAACLGDADRHVAEASRLALERIPGPAALAALVESVPRAAPEQKPHLIFSISKKGNDAVASVLVGWSRSDDANVRLAALEALARLGASAGRAPLAAAIASAATPDRGRLFGEHLRLAARLAERGEVEAAREMHRVALRDAPIDYQREQALYRLCPPGDEQALEILLVGLRDESSRVRRLALSRLALLEGPGVGEALRRAYEESTDAQRPALLQALAERDAALAGPLLERAAASRDIELKITALDLAGKLDDPAMEKAYVEAAQSGSALIRPRALKGYLLLADRRLEAGEKQAALEMFGRALDLAVEDASRRAALRGIIAAGDPRAIERLEPLLQDSLLAAEARAGYLTFAAAIGAAGDKDRAEKLLLPIVTGPHPRDSIARAAAELRKIGRDPQRTVRRQGFVLDWWLVGPIQDPDGKGIERPYFPEERVDLEALEAIDARRYRWQKLEDLALEGRIDLIPVFRRSERVIAYAYAEIESPQARDVLFKIGSDDGIACWLNGEGIHIHPSSRGFKLDEDSVPAHLIAGKNRILLKISQGSGAWEFALRITDRDGKALDLSGD
jgi:HEAT repeat protein